MERTETLWADLRQKAGKIMANIMDYMDWRGDLSFGASEFNEVDNLILAQLAYVDFEGIVPAGEDEPAVTLTDASRQFWKKNNKEEILARVSMTKSAPFVMEKMAKTKRFSDVKLRCYVNEIRDEEQFQFSAVCVELPDDSLYVAFRGTDNTITGWREDFNMGYLSETPGQLRAVEYLNRAVTDKKQSVRVGGHSKGGNFAMYASVKCDPRIQDQILNVYSNDGPGFRSDMVESAAYQRILPKLHTILPESSIVGMLLEHQESFEVVKSSNSGIQQHDAMSWEVLGRNFVHVDKVAAQSLLLDETMKSWIYQLDVEESAQIVETAFDMIEKVGIRTVDDFYHSKWKKIQELMKETSKLPPERQKLFSRALKLLWTEGNKAMKETVKQTVKRTVRQSPLKK